MGRHDTLHQEGEPGHTVTSVETRMAQVETRDRFTESLAMREVAVFEAKKMVRITRKMVVEGINHRRAFHVPLLGKDAVLIIRPISDVEYGQVQEMLLGKFDYEQLQNLDKKVDLNLEMVLEAERKAKHQTVAFALSCDGEKWDADDVGKLPPGVVDPIYNHTAVISGFRPASRAGVAG